MFTRIPIAALFLAGSLFGQTVPYSLTAEATHFPHLIRAELPLYPSLAWTAHISGMVEIQITVEKGNVVDARVKSGETKALVTKGTKTFTQVTPFPNPILQNESLANLKTWQFRSEDRRTFTVKYVYQIEGGQTPLPENPKIELDLPSLVKVTVRPFEPTRLY